MLPLDFTKLCILMPGCVDILLYMCQGVVLKLTVEKRVGKFLTIIIDLSVSPFGSLHFCFMSFVAALFGVCTFRLLCLLGGLTLYCYVKFYVCANFLSSEIYFFWYWYSLSCFLSIFVWHILFPSLNFQLAYNIIVKMNVLSKAYSWVILKIPYANLCLLIAVLGSFMFNFWYVRS